MKRENLNLTVCNLEVTQKNDSLNTKDIGSDFKNKKNRNHSIVNALIVFGMLTTTSSALFAIEPISCKLVYALSTENPNLHKPLNYMSNELFKMLPYQMRNQLNSYISDVREAQGNALLMNLTNYAYDSSKSLDENKSVDSVIKNILEPYLGISSAEKQELTKLLVEAGRSILTSYRGFSEYQREKIESMGDAWTSSSKVYSMSQDPNTWKRYKELVDQSIQLEGANKTIISIDGLGKLDVSQTHKAPVAGVVIDEATSQIAVVDKSGKISIRSFEKQTESLGVVGRWIRDFTSGQPSVEQGSISVIDLPASFELAGPGSKVKNIAFGANGVFVSLVGDSRIVYFARSSKGEYLGNPVVLGGEKYSNTDPSLGHIGQVNGFEFNADKTKLFSYGEDGLIFVWNVAPIQVNNFIAEGISAKLETILYGNHGPISEISVSGDGTLVAALRSFNESEKSGGSRAEWKHEVVIFIDGDAIAPKGPATRVEGGLQEIWESYAR